MAPRVFLLCILFTVGLLTGRSVGTVGLELTLDFSQEPQDVVAVRSKPLVLQCEVSSSTPGPVNISWTHDGEPIPLVNDSRRHLLPNGSLYFKKVLWKRSGPLHEGSTDQGLYRCVARNSVGSLVSRSAHLRVATMSHDFSETPYNTTTEEDDIARFSCQIESVPKALISWERNGNPLPQNSRYFTLDSGVLYITKVQPSDAGTYRCVAVNLLTKRQRVSSEGQLEVIPKSPIPRLPQIISEASAMIEARAGDNVTLDCAATGSPIPELTWMFLPRIPDSKQHPITNKTRNGINVLTLHQVTTAHTGTYTCIATSAGLDKQSTPVSKTVSVEVLEIPTFEKVPTSQVYLTAKTVRFECEVKDNKTTEVKWLKNGAELKINGRIKLRQAELVLSNTVTDDSGLYQCMARNKIGESWVAGRLLVNMSRFQPEPPQGLTCRTLSDSQVKLEWKEPAKFVNNITAYTIHYLPSDGGEERQEVSVNCSFLVQKLAAFTNYTFYVRAYSSKSASDQSKRTRCQTGEGVPLAAPQVSLTAISPTSLSVSWTPLSKEKAQGVVTEYKIQWRRKGQASSRVEQVKGDITDFVITGLHPGKRHQVRVLAATSKGWPNQPDDFEWKDEDTPIYDTQNILKAPTVHLTVVNSTSIEVTWSLSPENKYKPDGFRLYYRKLNSEKVGPINLTAITTQYLLGNLEPDSWYEVSVHGYYSEGPGESGLKAIHTLPLSGTDEAMAIPSMGLEPPTNLEAEPISPISINLTWTPPQSAINVSYYTVGYRLVQSSHPRNSSVYSYVSSTSNGVEVTCLKPHTLYEFAVRTHDHNNQHGPYSQKVECRTLEAVPSAVTDVQWRALNSSTIRVSWKEPQHTNGVIKNYEISVFRVFGVTQNNVRSVNVSNSKLSTEITDLEPNTRYYMSVRAGTQAGMGPPSEKITITIPVVPPQVTPPNERPPYSHNPKTDQHLGIVVGVAIGVGCIILCAIAIVWRRRCLKSASPECSGAGGGATCGSGSHHVNGNGYYREWDRSPASHAHIMATSAPSETHEMDYFVTAVTTNIPCDSNTDHLDTKGGYPNGQVNGLKHPLLTNGRIPNGQASRDRSSVRIIENPQFSRGSNVDPQQRVLLPVAKSRSSHSHSDRRSGSGGEEEVRLLADHHTPLLTLRGEETSLQPESSHESTTDNSGSDRDRTGDISSAEIGVNDLDLNATQVTNLDLSFDGGALNEGGNQSSHQNQQQHNSQQHSPHHHFHQQQQQQHNNNHHHNHQNNSSHNSHSLHHIDNNTGTTTTRSQFHPPFLQQSPPYNSSSTTVTPQTELFHSAAATVSPHNDLLLNQ
ncbi:protogenin-like [Periplaneta americana]|uniref:protogenin-like n=1 Tax=Periplaneta americana TaxID=6978 RepID=UPI0037E8A658